MAHYLEDEFYDQVRHDRTIIDFLQHGSLDGIWYWDLQESENEWYSPRLTRSLGYSNAEVPSLSSWWQERIHPDDKAVAFDNFAKHLEDPNHPYDQVVRYRHRDGHTVWVRCRGIIIRDADGVPQRMLGAHTDVTALKEAELALQRELDKLTVLTGHLEDSNRDLETFAYVASHDLKEPLRAVSGFAHLLERDYEGILDERGKMLLGHLMDGAERMESLLEAVLEWGRAGVSSVATTEDACDLNAVVDQAVGLLGEWDEDTSIKVHPLPRVKGERSHLARVFANLLSNSRKYRHATRPLAIEISCVDEADYVRIDVVDNGMGFDPKYNDRVLQPFKRLHARDRIPGSGIGLALVVRTMRFFGGRVAIEGKPDQGAVVSLWFVKAV